MNNAKMWLVVPPAVGVPLFLAGVAVGSFAVHVAVLSNTSWVDDFLQGKPLGSGDSMAATTVMEPETTVTPASMTRDLSEGAQEVTVILPDGSVAKAIIESEQLVSTGQSL